MRSFDTDPVEVPLGACYCPGSPHDTDIVYLAPELSMSGGMAARQVIADYIGDTDPVHLQEGLANVWVRHGVIAWNIVDFHGPIEVTADNVKAALPYGKGGRLVAERADDLYSEAILAPLVEASKNSLRRSRTNASTSATTASTGKRRSPSSTATTDKAPAAA